MRSGGGEMAAWLIDGQVYVAVRAEAEDETLGDAMLPLAELPVGEQELWQQWIDATGGASALPQPPSWESPQ